MADGWVSDGAVSIRMYTPGSFLGGVAGELGLENAWTGEGDPDYGLAQTDVEGLTELGEDVHFLYVGNDTDGGDAFKDGLAGNAIWEQLPFVVAGNRSPACPTASGCSAARSRLQRSSTRPSPR